MCILRHASFAGYGPLHGYTGDKMTRETCTADHMVHTLHLYSCILHVSNQKGEQGLEMKPTAGARQGLGMRLWYMIRNSYLHPECGGP